MALVLIGFMLCYFASVPSALRCYTNTCPRNAPLCIEHCTTGSNACYSVLNSTANINGNVTINQLVQLSCTNITCNFTDCNYSPVNVSDINLTYCCCKDDLCNKVPSLTDLIPPGHDAISPAGILICVKYNCSMDGRACYHGYEVCSETSTNEVQACFSTYKQNQTAGRFILDRKGCHSTSSSVGSSQDLCHIDNRLHVVSSADDGHSYSCSCNSLLCNVQESFTHGVEFSIHGIDVCNSIGCNHSCLISPSLASCHCPVGYALYNGTECIDINECSHNNGGCSDNCFNVPGSFYCDCKSGRIMSPLSNTTCIDNSQLYCINRICDANFRCTETTLQSCGLSNKDNDPLDYLNCQAIVIRFHNGSFFPLLQSCFRGNPSCESQCLMTDSFATNDVGDLFICCCSGYICNHANQLTFLNVSSSVSPSTTVTLLTSSSIDHNTTGLVRGTADPNVAISLLTSGIFVAIAVVFVIGLLTVMLVCLYFYAYKKRNRFPAVVHAARSLSPLLTVEPQFIEVIHEGALASVHRARRGREEIVVKLFPDTPESKKSWNQEMNIYMTENLKHDNLLRFIDFAENIKEENTYWLLFDYHPFGSLYDYLHESSITIKELAVFAKSIADGLSHLHSCNGKSSIAHRDLKSKNILVKQDLTCCISDLGVAIRFDPGHNYFKRAVIQIGTSRYMAPEVLQKAVSYTVDAYLQIDVFAFSLVLWEMVNMCKITEDDEERSYQPPYYEHVHPNPTVYDMKTIVDYEKIRPTIRPEFLNDKMYEELVYVMVRGWDSDPEARPLASMMATKLDQFYHQAVSSLASPPVDVEQVPDVLSVIVHHEGSHCTGDVSAAVPIDDGANGDNNDDHDDNHGAASVLLDDGNVSVLNKTNNTI